MGKPSIFNSNYHKIMRRRKIAFRTVIILVALVAVVFTYYRPAVPNLKKIVDNFKIASLKTQTGKPEKKDNTEPTGEKKEVKTDMPEQNVQQPAKAEQGEYVFKLTDTESVSLLYEKNGNEVKFTGIKPDNLGVSFDISDDGKAMVFDNPRTSDIWLYYSDGRCTILDSDYFMSSGKNPVTFDKKDKMNEFKNKYVWAAKPKFLKDGRIVYQSHLPWFKETNTIYLWVVNPNGSDSFWFLDTKQVNPVNYSGFAEDGSLIVEIGGSKYAVNINDRTRRKIN